MQRAREAVTMKSMLCVFCFFSALATGSCLICTTCLVQGASTCTGDNVTCDSATVCVSTHTVTTEDGIKIGEFFGRTCMPTCYAPGSFSTGNRKSRKGVSCCNTDNCAPSAPVLPALSDEPNGVVCQTCMEDDAEWCDTGLKMSCTGEETKCILQISAMTGALTRKTVVRGCATQSICNIGNETVITNGISVTVSISCTDGGTSLCHSIFSPALVALGLIKSLYYL